MCHSRDYNNKINRLHERCLGIIYNDKHTSFEELLDMDKSVTIHTHYLQILATEMFKMSKGISPKIFNEIFNTKNPNSYNSRQSC